MPAVDEEVEALIAKRKDHWRKQFRNDPAQAAAYLREKGMPSLGDSLLQGLEQGAAHGFADDVERMTSGGVAKNQIRAQAAHPAAYMLASILGTSLTGLGLRGTGGVVGKA